MPDARTKPDARTIPERSVIGISSCVAVPIVVCPCCWGRGWHRVYLFAQGRVERHPPCDTCP